MLTRPRRSPTFALRRLALAATALALLLPATAPAAELWSPAPAPVPEGAPDDPVEAGKRLRNDVAVDRGGTAWIAWVQTDDQTATVTPPAVQTLRVSRRAAGAAWAAPQDVTAVQRAAGSNYQALLGPEITVDRAGLPTVAWGVRVDATTVLVRAASRDASGAWSTPADLASVTVPSGQPLTLSLDVEDDGRATVAWQGQDAVRLAQRATDGSWGTPETVATVTVDLPDAIGLGHDAAGALTVVWREGTSNGDRSLHARTRSAAGSWATPATLTAATGFVSRPALVVDATGAAVATWGSGDGPRAAARAGSSAASWQTPEVLAAGAANAAPTATGAAAFTTGGTGLPSAAFDAHGNATVVWPVTADTTAGTPARVRARRFSAAGTWDAAEDVASEPTADNPPLWPRIVPGRDGGATVAWTTAVKVTFVGGVANPTGGTVRVATRVPGGGAWSAPRTYATAASGTFGTLTALGVPDTANLALAGDPLGNATLGWSPYASAVTFGLKRNETVDFQPAVAPALDWTARGVVGSSNLRTWIDYVHADWPGPGPRTAHAVEVGDGASFPEPGDRYSWRLTSERAWRDPASGRLVVRYRGAIRWVNTAHYIDIRLVNPRLEVDADERHARLYVDGRTSGSRADAEAGHPGGEDVSNVRMLEIDLAGPGPRTSGDGASRSWVAASSTLSAVGALTFGLDQYAGQPFGFLTITVPTTLQDPPTDPGPGDGGGDGPGGGSSGGSGGSGGGNDGGSGGDGGGGTAKPKPGVTGQVRGKKVAKRHVTVTLSKRLGRVAARSYRVVLRSGRTTVASGTLKGRTLRLTVAARTVEGKPSYRRIRGRYALASPARHRGKRLPASRRIATTAVTIR